MLVNEQAGGQQSKQCKCMKAQSMHVILEPMSYHDFVSFPDAFEKVHESRSVMDLNQLPSIILAITEQRSLDAVLSKIIQVVAGQSEVALARLWLRDTDRNCPHCAASSTSSEPALHLRASSGTPLDQVEEMLIADALRRARGDKEKAARMLGISARTLYRRVSRHEAEEEHG